jgi:hypothetical protein
MPHAFALRSIGSGHAAFQLLAAQQKILKNYTKKFL